MFPAGLVADNTHSWYSQFASGLVDQLNPCNVTKAELAG